MKGTVKRLKIGYGFIRGTDDVEYFFHGSTVVGGKFDSLKEGDSVTFEIEEDSRGKGPRASGVEKSR